MGNSMTVETHNAILNKSRNIMNMRYNTLQLGERQGLTGYLDFIQKSELGDNNIMKGQDMYNRYFIVVKSYFLYKDNTHTNMFTTFFQRYDNNNTLWMSAGSLKYIMMHTDGGMSLDQFILLNDLLTNGSVDLTKELLLNCNLNCYPNYNNLDDYDDDTKIPIKLVIGNL